MRVLQKRNQAVQQIVQMDYQTQLYVSNCESYLMNPDNIEPNELAKYFASFSHYGINDLITSLVQRYFYFNLNHPELLRYIQLLDRLIKYSFPLPQSFAQMFATCFNISVSNGRRSIQEELKIFRKIWTPILSQDLIEQLRFEVYKLTRIDIEIELREESKKFLFQHFQKNMGLTSQQILQILTKKVPMRRTPETRSVLAPRIMENEENLRTRKIPSDWGQKPKPNQTRQSSRRQASLALYSRLRNLNSYECKQCGRYFQTEAALSGHKEEHFAEKMAQFRSDRERQMLKACKMAKKKAGRVEERVGEWCGDMQRQQQRAMVPVGSETDTSKSCYFCGAQLEVAMIDDSLVYKNTIQAQVSCEWAGETTLMHLGCFATLASSGPP